MTDLEILEAARAKIADPKHWTTCASARDASGIEVAAWDSEAVCWCAYGALDSIESNTGADTIRRAAGELFGHTVVSVNDLPEFGHEAVLKMYDHAIAEERARSC